MQCEAGLYGQCLLEIWAGKDSSGPLLFTFGPTYFMTANNTIFIPSKQIFIRFSADSPNVLFMARWNCAQGKLP